MPIVPTGTAHLLLQWASSWRFRYYLTLLLLGISFWVILPKAAALARPSQTNTD